MTVDLGGLHGLASAPLQILLMETQARVDLDGSASHFEHGVRLIRESAGLEMGSQLQIEFDPSYQQLVLHRLDVWRDGVRLDRLPTLKVDLLQRESQLEQQMLDGRVTASVVLADIRVGDRIEWSYTLHGDNPVFAGRFVDDDVLFSVRGPTAVARYRLLAPVDRVMTIQAANDRHEVHTSVKEGWRETLITRRNVPVMTFDPTVPRAYRLADFIHVSEFPDWAAVADWADREFAVAKTPSALVKKTVDELREPGMSDEALVLRLLVFVQRDIRYFGTEVGVSSHRPAPPDKVLQQRFGDCKDKVTLLSAMLAVAGIEATPVLVSTGLREAIRDQLPATPRAFDHVIVDVRLGERHFLLDATRSMQTGPLADRVVRGLGWGLPAKVGTTALVAIDPAHDDLRVEEEDTIRVGSFLEDPQFDVKLVMHGDTAEAFRSWRASMSDAEIARQLAAVWVEAYTGLSMDGNIQMQDIPDHNALDIRLHGQFHPYLELQNKSTLRADIALVNLINVLRLPDQSPRSKPLQLAQPGIYRHRVRHEFPESVFQKKSTLRFDETTKNLDFHLRGETEGLQSWVEGEIRIKSSTLAAEDWSAHREMLMRLWPKLKLNLSLSAFRKDGIDKVTAQLRQLEQKDAGTRAKGEPTSTKTQGKAHVGLIMTAAALAGGRLNPAQQADVLAEQAEMQEWLIESDAVKASLTQALQLNPALKAAYVLQARHAQLNGDADRAVELATQAMRFESIRADLYSIRAAAHFMAGHPSQARDDYLEVMRLDAHETERGYAPLLWWLAHRRMGAPLGEALPVTMQKAAESSAWPWPVMRMLQGKISREQAEQAAKVDPDERRERLCELYFYVGEQALIQGDLAQARWAFERSMATGVTEYFEYRWSALRLKALAAKDRL
ncbi:DUF3857 domain-containing protein [Leptothrix ochracea]|uniref:DUF3857 domain-containing protein n=1 Tax=Leptothrix ochracea TaxID=735331 RepID=UPI0034E2812A